MIQDEKTVNDRLRFLKKVNFISKFGLLELLWDSLPSHGIYYAFLFMLSNHRCLQKFYVMNERNTEKSLWKGGVSPQGWLIRPMSFTIISFLSKFSELLLELERRIDRVEPVATSINPRSHFVEICDKLVRFLNEM